MSRSVVFRTPGLIPIRAFTAFGVNSKPETTSPIGFFGTGLKYAIAVLMRERISVVMWRGTTKYTFLPRTQSFRDKEFTFIDLKRERGLFNKTTELPFTTELGKNWELWQAFRELYSNTMDENGLTYVLSSDFSGAGDVSAGETYIVVEGDAFVQEFIEKDKTFHPFGWKNQQANGEAVQLIPKPGKAIFWRGMRVYDLPKDKHSIYTWNILSPLELTEDRTLKSYYSAEFLISAHVASKVATSVAIQVLKAPEKTFEHNLDYTFAGCIPSKEFLQAVEHVKPPKTSYARRYTDRYETPEPEETLTGGDQIDALIAAIKKGSYSRVEELIEMDRDHVIHCLEAGQAAVDAENALPYDPDQEVIEPEEQDRMGEIEEPAERDTP